MKKISIQELENENIFDCVIDDIYKNKASYRIYSEEEYINAIAVMIPINEYYDMAESIN